MARSFRLAVFAAALACVGLAAPQAHAWVRFGVGVFPFPYAPFPYYAPPPPVYYAPPPVIYAPPPTYAPPQTYAPPAASGPVCYAGPYVCPLTQSLPAGYSCSCPSNDGGRVSGRTG